MPYPTQITLPVPIKVSLNAIYAGRHWKVRADEATVYHLLLKGKPKYDGDYPVQITYKFFFKGRVLDSTNVAYLAKLCEDGLVRNGLIKDDDWKSVKRTILEVNKDPNEHIEIEIKEYKQ